MGVERPQPASKSSQLSINAGLIVTSMPAITVFISWFAQNAAIRTLTGVLFFAALGFALIRLTGKLSFSLFILVGVGFSGLFFVSPAAHLLIFLGLLLMMGVYELRRARLGRPYQPAVTVVESGGIKRGLTPAEAAVLLEMPVGTVVAVALLGLLRKGALVVTQQAPLVFEVAAPLQVKGAAPGEQAALRRRAAQDLTIIIQPYDEPFLMQIEAQAGEPIRLLNLVAPIRSLLRHTARRVAGHNIAETQTYYRQHLGRARHDVAHFGESPNGQKVRDHHFEWLLLDDSFATLYADTQPAWMAQPENREETLAAWVEKLVDAAEAAVAPESLQVKDAAGRRLAIGGPDPITLEFFTAVAENVR
jgi:hypothetical protein